MSKEIGCGQHCPDDSFPVPCSTCDRAWMNKPSKQVEKLTEGCVVLMSKESNLTGYGNNQCVNHVCEELGTIGLYGHNQHYKIHHVSKVVKYHTPDPLAEAVIQAAIKQVKIDIPFLEDDLVNSVAQYQKAKG